MERRLTAILAADVVGYSRLMGANESGTVTARMEGSSSLPTSDLDPLRTHPRYQKILELVDP